MAIQSENISQSSLRSQDVNFLMVMREKTHSGVFSREMYSNDEKLFGQNPVIFEKTVKEYLPNGQSNPVSEFVPKKRGRQKSGRFGEDRVKTKKKWTKDSPLDQFLYDCLLNEDYQNTTVSIDMKLF